ncbi:uncharacterized protein Tco025E_04693 [Trypanosoma conorhini]|uniref:BAR domain-containing protein n=1 Tax=Trypanosoma conorhini TaxID=83891 RepID=A0A422PJR8_9TRYP|nr:uncharacterized protein Tco025E_04693 [Trypanosoma conorhini]RNF17962.1 hypothetical protein Tco025E_04693 [Trypanosoma conorhini]
MECCTKIPETVDRELDENGAYLERTAKTVKGFEKNIAETINLFQALMGSFERVANAFTELADGTDSQTVQLTRGFAGGMKKLRDGRAMSSLQMDVTQYVKEGIPPILVEHEKVYKMYKHLKELKRKEDTYRYKIGQTEREYAKKNRALAESPSYIKLGKGRDKAGLKYQEKKQEFDAAIGNFKLLVSNFLMTSLPGYAACTSGFSKHLGQEMEAYSSGEALRTARSGSTSNQTQHRLSTKSVESGKSKRGSDAAKNPLTLEQQYYSSSEQTGHK